MRQHFHSCSRCTNTITSITPVDDGRAMAKLKLKSALRPLGYEKYLTRPTKCDTCKKDLTIKIKEKGSGKYWKSCRTCLEKKTASKRKRASATPFSIADTAETTKKKRNTNYNPGAVRPSLSLFSSESQQPASTSGPEHTPSPDTVPTVQSATTSYLMKQSDESDFDVAMSRPQRDFERSRSQSPSQASMEARTFMFRHVFAQAFRDDFQKRIRASKRAEISNNEAPEKSSRVVVLKLPRTKICSVCAETLPWKRFPKLADCEHDPEVCSGCFLLWLKQQMESVTNILCPSSGCSHAITHEDVRKNAPQDVFTR